MSRRAPPVADIAAWLAQEPETSYREELKALLRKIAAGDTEGVILAEELFGSRRGFGTAGIRGPMRAGPTGLNRVVISQTAAGLAEYLLTLPTRQKNVAIRCVIGFDSRHSSNLFAKDTAEVMSGYGVHAYLLPRMLPTPLLAFAVRKLNSDAGVMVTASHNPPGDNGLKVYVGGSEEGAQIISPAAGHIESHIKRIAEGQSWYEIPRSTEDVNTIEESIVEAYISACRASLDFPPTPTSSLSIVYTPMHGVGGETFLAAVHASGFPAPHAVEDQFQPDPDFPTVAFPNPEEKGALDLSFETARAVGADLIIAHDPDADRLAVALPDASSPAGYRALSGNQVGAIFGWYLGEKAHFSGKPGKFANSLVSSPVLGKIAEHFGLDHEETLTGFKFISRVKNLIFGFEEALGYLVTPDVARDKDGISAGLLMVFLAHTLEDEGRTLWDYLHEIEEAVGAFASGQIIIRPNTKKPGSNVTSALRDKKITAIGSRFLKQFDDFLDGVENFPPDNILRYYLSDGSRVIVRPSGTEPKVKVYLDTTGATRVEAEAALASLEQDVRGLLASLN